MHLKRIITAIVAFPLLSLLIFKGTILLFTLFISIVSLIALYEYYRIVFSDKKEVIFSLIPVWGGLCGVLIIGAAYIHPFPQNTNFSQLVTGLLVLNFIGAAIMSMPQYKNGPEILNVVEKVLFL